MTMDRHDTIGAMLDEYALGQLRPTRPAPHTM